MSWTRLYSVVVKELLSYLRDPRSRASLIVPPLLQLLIFSFAATLEVRNVDVAVLDHDAGVVSGEVVERVRAAGFVDEIVPVWSDAELRRAVDERRVLLAIRFGDDFSRDVLAGRPAKAQVIVDGRRANAGQIALGYLGTIVEGMAEEVRLVGGGTAPSRTPPQIAPEVVVRNWFNPNLVYLWFIVPSLAGILSMFLSLLVTGLSIARERELGTFDQLLVSPVRPLEMILGKTLPALLIGTVMGSLMVAAAAFLFRVPFTGSVLLLEASLVLFILSVVGIGLMVSALCHTQQQAILGVFTVGIPVILISGFATPVENMPGWLQVAAEASPLKHFLIIVQGSFLKALPPSEVFANAWPMAVIALFTLSFANLFVRRRLR